jgi:hypothetical protein
MDLIQTMEGEFAGSEFGSNLASIDFNADGYEDLVVASQAWNPYGVYADSARYGKLYFFWGGPTFDNIPDFVISGAYYYDIGSSYAGLHLYNVGDVNGDGTEDIALSSNTINHDLKISIFFGRQSPHTEPDVVLTYPTASIYYISIFPLGDIDDDGLDDIGLTINRDLRYTNTLMIWTDVTTTQPWFFRQTTNQYAILLINGIGDINNDGIDDCFLQLPIQGLDQDNRKLVVYYGDTTFPVTDSLVISEDTNAVTSNWASPVGDVNNDGFGDFVAYNNHLWKGSPNLTPSWDYELVSVYGFVENGSGYPFQFGDFNNDGYDDILGSNHGYGYWSGVINVWMGRSQMNGNLDLRIFPPLDYENRNFGWAKAAGDFNGDGFDDIAVSAPWWANTSDHNQTGRVFVYAGNAELADTTVGNEDEVLPEHCGLWSVMLSPNPLTGRQDILTLKLSGPGYKDLSRAEVTLSNIKGQVIHSVVLTAAELQAGSVNLTPGALPSGLYLLSVRQGKTLLSTAKLSVIR